MLRNVYYVADRLNCTWSNPETLRSGTCSILDGLTIVTLKSVCLRTYWCRYFDLIMPFVELLGWNISKGNFTF